MSEPMSRDEFKAAMMASMTPMQPEEAADLMDREAARKEKQREYARKAYEKKKAKKAEAAADPEAEEPKKEAKKGPEPVVLSAGDADLLSGYIRNCICYAIEEMDCYNTPEMIFKLVHLADRLELKEER